MDFKYPLDYISKITLVLNSPSLIVFQVKGNEVNLKKTGGNISSDYAQTGDQTAKHEIVLETLRRTELILFLVSSYESKKLQRPKIDFKK